MKPKSHSGTKKRVRKTGSGKLKVEKACCNHLLFQKSKKQKALKKHPLDLASGFGKKVKHILHN